MTMISKDYEQLVKDIETNIGSSENKIRCASKNKQEDSFEIINVLL